MQVAIASGKGGTGKTTVATNLALCAARAGARVAYVDCDVEEPNGHIFLKPQIAVREKFCVQVPQVDLRECVHCGKCGEICQYSAIACVGRKVLVFPELCHACGGCAAVCPSGAITEVPREMGIVEVGSAGKIEFVQGVINVGEAMSPPLIRAARSAVGEADLVFVDAPPGTSCPVIESVRGCDYVVLVTEPTPFGLHDLDLAVQMVRALAQPFGVVVNRADLAEQRARHYCRQRQIEILAEIPDDRRIAQAYSRGQMACEALPELSDLFDRLLASIRAGASQAIRGTGA